MNVIPFSELLEEENRLIAVEDTTEYACGGVRLSGKGVFVREFKYGSQILKKFVQHVVREDDVVYSTLFAGKGAYAVADKLVDGTILSEKFPTFRLVDDAVDLDYMRWFFRAGILNEIAAKQVTGIAAFSLSHLSKTKFLKLGMPVPSADRQEKVVSICRDVNNSKIAAIKAFNENRPAIVRLVGACATELMASCETRSFGELGQYLMRNAVIDPIAKYKQVTVAMNNKELRLRRICDGSEIRSPGQCYVNHGDLLFSRIDIRNGAIGFVPKALDGAVVTRDFPIFALDDSEDVRKRFLNYEFLTPRFKEQASEHSRGTTGRKKMRRERFLEFLTPWPKLDIQKSIVGRLDKVAIEHGELARRSETQINFMERCADANILDLFRRDAGIS